MTKGKYANKAHFRMQTIESERIRELLAEAQGLKAELAKAKHENDVLRSDVHSKAMQAASALSADEKRELRNKVAQLEADARKDKLKSAVLAYDVAFRFHYGKAPSHDAQKGVGMSDLANPIAAALGLNVDEFIEYTSEIMAANTSTTCKKHVMWAKQNRAGFTKHLAEWREYVDKVWDARQRGYIYSKIKNRGSAGGGNEAKEVSA